MPELIAHKVQIAFPAQSDREQPDNHVHRHATCNHYRARSAIITHACVHLGVHEPECDGLVSNDRLVMALGIGNRLLAPSSAIAHRRDNLVHSPVLVLDILEKRDPHVWQGHGKPIVEADATFSDGHTQARHAGNILCDHHSIWSHTSNQLTCQHQVDNCIHVRGHSEVLLVVAGEAHVKAVVVVQHRCHTVEAEAVTVVLLQPPS
mmetsp:Transcript_103716/g.246931  ORF Transcript_103716/g.246931 Transcript_103716/m.246931 type:complete len:206 (-) Transcript_103716:960-1577(-)